MPQPPFPLPTVGGIPIELVRPVRSHGNRLLGSNGVRHDPLRRARLRCVGKDSSVQDALPGLGEHAHGVAARAVEEAVHRPRRGRKVSIQVVEASRAHIPLALGALVAVEPCIRCHDGKLADAARDREIGPCPRRVPQSTEAILRPLGSCGVLEKRNLRPFGRRAKVVAAPHERIVRCRRVPVVGIQLQLVRAVPPTLDATHAVGPATVVACLTMPEHAAGFCAAVAVFIDPSVANIAKDSDLKISSRP